METPFGLLVLLLALLLVVVTPILAISAYLRIRRLENTGKGFSLPTIISRIYGLEQRLATLEKTLTSSALAPSGPPPVAPGPPRETRPAVPIPSVPSAAAPASTPLPQPPRAPAPPAQVAPAIFAAPPLVSPWAKTSSSLDLETLIAGRWLNRIGILAILFAVSFFLKYAFDNNWIGPSGRVAIGILLGSAMLPWSQWLLRRGYPYFSEGIAGLGEAILFLSIWAGWHYYALFSQTVAFGAMIVVTAVMAAVALGRNSQRIALLSLLGGFLTPELVSTGLDQQVVLFTYLLFLGAGLLVIAALRDWRSLVPASFVLTQFYFWGWYESFYSAEKLEPTLFFATLFFLLYAAVPILRVVYLGLFDQLDIGLILFNAGIYLLVLHQTLWPGYRWTLTLFVLALSAAHLAVARLSPPPNEKESPLVRLVFAGLALTFATLAIPIRLDGKWITIAWAIEGAVLILTGFRVQLGKLRAAGVLLVAIAALRTLFLSPSAHQFLFNERFLTYAVVIAALAVSLFAARSAFSSLSEEEKSLYAFFAIAINAFILISFSLELWDYFGRLAGLQLDRWLAQHLSLSIFWTAYATLLILLGVSRKSALLRWQALALLGIVVVKVFVYDLSFLERFYRILSFFFLGLVLLVVSFLYQRKLARERSPS